LTILIVALPIPMISLIDRYLASALPRGSISYLAYSWTLTVALVSLFSRGIFAVLFPTLAENVYVRYHDFQRLATKMIKFFLLLGFTGLPVIMFLRGPMINVVLMHGRFTSADAVQVAGVLQWHLIGMVGIVLFHAVNRITYATGWYSISILGALLQISVYTGAAIVLVARLSIIGLAMANALSWLITATVLIILISRKGALGDVKSFVSSTLQILTVAVCLTTALFAGVSSLHGATWWLISLLITSGIGFFFMIIRVMKDLGIRLRYP
jgi:putative peptidoglycan lipid II flippase